MRFAIIFVAPALAAAMQSAPAPSSPASQVVGTSTYFATSTLTITSCAESVTNCPSRSTVTSVTSYPVVTTTTKSAAPPASTAPSTQVPASSTPLVQPSCPPPQTVTSYVTICPSAPGVPGSSAPPYTGVPASSAPPHTGVPASSAPPYTGVPASSAPPAAGVPGSSNAPAVSVPATSVPASKGVASPTNAFIPPKNTTVAFNTNGASSAQAGGVALAAVAGVVALFL